MTTRRLLILLLLAFLVYGAAVEARDELIGKQAPEIAALSWLNSAPQTLAALKGRPVLVEFWATWCPPCRRSIPQLNELYRKYSAQGVAFVSLTDETYDTVKNFAAELQIAYPVGTGSPSAEAYGVRGIPHAVLVGADGRILWSGHPLDQLASRLDSALAAMSKEEREAIRPTTDKTPVATDAPAAAESEGTTDKARP